MTLAGKSVVDPPSAAAAAPLAKLIAYQPVTVVV